jgi:acetyl-CoA C-acetyltransferase
MEDVAIVGVGMHPFGRWPNENCLEIGAAAVRAALKDAGIAWKDAQFAVGGTYTHWENADGLTRYLGLTGIQFQNVLNNCATGGSMLSTGANLIRCGAFELGVVVGFDKHERGSFTVPDETYYGKSGLALTIHYFGMKINRYMHLHGISEQTLARVAAKNYENGSKNPNAWRTKPLSVEEILASPYVAYPLRQYMFCGPDEGGVALVLSRADQAHRYTDKPVFLKANQVRTRRYGAFEVNQPTAPIELGEGPTQHASRAAFEQAGLGPEDIDIAQLQDTEAGAEVIHMAENGFCRDGEQEALIGAGETKLDGRLPVNTDGGCIANGEPVAASGLRQIHESVLQIRVRAGRRQVPKDVKTAYTQVYGAPGVAAVNILTR